jgi:hypothetical protein
MLRKSSNDVCETVFGNIQVILRGPAAPVMTKKNLSYYPSYFLTEATYNTRTRFSSRTPRV